MADLSFLSNDELTALQQGDYSKLSNESLTKLQGGDFGGQMAKPASIGQQAFDQLTNISDPTSKEGVKMANYLKAVISSDKSINPTAKDPATQNLSPKVSDKIQGIKSAQKSLVDLLELKNSGFGGKGIDTGPIVGGAISDYIPFVEDGKGKFLPSGLDEFVNQTFGKEGENSSDRTKLRQKILELLNPVRKNVTGAAASNEEIGTYILPGVPNESDNDQGFFGKGINSLRKSQQDLIDTLDVENKSGRDISKFKDEFSTSPDAAVEKLLQVLTANQNGSYTNEFPEATKSFLQKLLQNKSTTQGNSDTPKPTHRFNPATGKVEAIQ